MTEENKTPEVVLVGGSKDGAVTEQTPDTKAINNIVLNDAKDGPEYIDLYMPAALTDKEGRPIYVHIGRYDASESKSYWDSLTESEKAALVDAANAQEEFVEEEKNEETTEEVLPEESGDTKSSASEDETTETAPAEPPVVTEHAVEEVQEPVDVSTEATEATAEENGPVVESEHAEASEEKTE
jgi:hypothetical protein